MMFEQKFMKQTVQRRHKNRLMKQKFKPLMNYRLIKQII